MDPKNLYLLLLDLSNHLRHKTRLLRQCEVAAMTRLHCTHVEEALCGIADRRTCLCFSRAARVCWQGEGVHVSELGVTSL